MPKSRNRKNHNQKVQARNSKLKGQEKKMMEQMEDLQKKYVEEMANKAKESDDSGEVPFTLGDK